MNRLLLTAIAATSALATGMLAAHAGSLVTLLTPGTPYFSGLSTLGFEFTAPAFSAGGEVAWLGVYDQGGVPLPTDAMVGLWDTFGDLLGSAIVPADGGFVMEDFRYSSFDSAITIAPGADYVVGAYLATGWATSINTGQGGTGFSGTMKIDSAMSVRSRSPTRPTLFRAALGWARMLTWCL
jgi:hypothetical protein